MKLTKKVGIKGYTGHLPVYLVDELAEQTGGDRACKLHIALAAVDDDHQIQGTPSLIIVVSKKFLRWSKRTQLALLAYHNELPKQEDYDFLTQKGPDMAAKTEVVAMFGKRRFRKAFRTLERAERKSVVRCAGKIHCEYKKTVRDEKKLVKQLGMTLDRFDGTEDVDIDLVDYFQKLEHGPVEVTSYKGASVTPSNIGVNIPHLPETEDYGDDVEEETETVVTDAAATDVSPAMT